MAKDVEWMPHGWISIVKDMKKRWERVRLGNNSVTEQGTTTSPLKPVSTNRQNVWRYHLCVHSLLERHHILSTIMRHPATIIADPVRTQPLLVFMISESQHPVFFGRKKDDYTTGGPRKSFPWISTKPELLQDGLLYYKRDCLGHFWTKMMSIAFCRVVRRNQEQEGKVGILYI